MKRRVIVHDLAWRGPRPDDFFDAKELFIYIYYNSPSIYIRRRLEPEDVYVFL